MSICIREGCGDQAPDKLSTCNGCFKDWRNYWRSSSGGIVLTEEAWAIANPKSAVAEAPAAPKKSPRMGPAFPHLHEHLKDPSSPLVRALKITPTCDCGGEKANTTHAKWCSSLGTQTTDAPTKQRGQLCMSCGSTNLGSVDFTIVFTDVRRQCMDCGSFNYWDARTYAHGNQ